MTHVGERGLRIVELAGVESLVDLAAEAEHESYGMVTRLIEEWRSGSNRFEGPGEALYGARLDEQIVGVCGLNVDPFAETPEIGRVRRLYVSTRHRRRGIGSALVSRVMTDAARRFAVLHVRTYEPAADSFYRSSGFARVIDNTHCTHRLELPQGLSSSFWSASMSDRVDADDGRAHGSHPDP